LVILLTIEIYNLKSAMASPGFPWRARSHIQRWRPRDQRRNFKNSLRAWNKDQIRNFANKRLASHSFNMSLINTGLQTGASALRTPKAVLTALSRILAGGKPLKRLVFAR